MGVSSDARIPMMEGRHFTDAGEFLDSAGPLLLSDRARHQLILSILGVVQKQSDMYESYDAWAVFEDDKPVAAASMTAPWNLVLADALSDISIAGLVSEVSSSGSHVPGVIGNRPTVDRFSEAWSSFVGCEWTVEADQGVFALEVVNPLPRSPGEARPMTPEETGLVVDWWIDFAREALPAEGPLEERLHEVVKRNLDPDREQAIWLWEVDAEPVSMSGHSSFSFGGSRIGPVYTPPEKRGKGFGTSLVADQSQHLLDLGLEFVYLYTDLSNPTSNAIYNRIGYSQVAESAQIAFRYDTDSP